MLVPERRRQIIRNAIEPYSAMIAVEHAGRVCHHGSGFYFAVDNSYFLVTAWHLVANALEFKAPLYLPSDVEDGRAFRLRGKWVGITKSKLDVAVYKLSSDERMKLAARRFARLSDCLSVDPPNGTNIVLHGVLNECSDTWSAHGPVGSPRLISAVFVTPLTEPNDVPQSVDGSVQHCCNADWVWLEAENTGLSVPETVKGISGCAAWAVRGNPFAEDWQLNARLICSVQSDVLTMHAQHRSFCRITKWSVVFHLIATHYPLVAETAKHLSTMRLVRRI